MLYAATLTGSALPYHTTHFSVQAWQHAADNVLRVLRASSIFRLRAAAVAVSLCVTPQASSAQAARVDTVHILSCTISSPRPLSRRATGIRIVYVNAGPTLVHDVTFAVDYRTAGDSVHRTFRDVGTFAPNTRVNHHFDAFGDVRYAAGVAPACRVTAVR